MFHEVNHYLQKLIDQEFKYPHWPGESLAEYYGAGSWDQEEKKLVVGGIQEGRLSQIQSDMASGKMIGLQELITEDRFEDYTWGWSLVHFMMHDERYAKDFRKFFLGLATARDVEREPRAWGSIILKAVTPEEVWRSFKKYMSLDTQEEIDAFQEAWHAYVKALEITSARGKERAAVQAWQSEGREVRAERLFSEAIEGGSTNPVTYYQFGNMLYGNGERDRAVELWRQASELDPMSAEYHYSVGYALRKSDKEESKRLMALAEELDPEVEDKAYVSSILR
jgi:tetratricopeptide (TPR) repeat protein